MTPAETIRTRLSAGYLAAHRQRLSALTDAQAPSVLLKAEREKISQAEAGNLPIRRLEEFGELTIESWTVKKGRLGKQFIEIMTGIGLIYYFPNGRYGPFLKKADEPDRSER